MTTTNNGGKLQIPPSLSKFDDDPGQWKVYKADLKAVLVMNGLDSVVDDEPKARVTAVIASTPRSRTLEQKNEEGVVIREAQPAYAPDDNQKKALINHENSIRYSFALIMLTMLLAPKSSK